MAFIYVISKESEEEQQEGSSDAADGHGESSTAAGKRNTAHMQYRKGTYWRFPYVQYVNGSSHATFGIYCSSSATHCSDILCIAATSSSIYCTK